MLNFQLQLNKWVRMKRDETTNHMGKSSLEDASLLLLILNSRPPILMASGFFAGSWCRPRRRWRRCRIRRSRGFLTNMVLIGDLRIRKFLWIGSCGEGRMVEEGGRWWQPETVNAIYTGGHADDQTLRRRSIHVSVGPPLWKWCSEFVICLLNFHKEKKSPNNNRFHVVTYYKATWPFNSQNICVINFENYVHVIAWNYNQQFC